MKKALVAALAIACALGMAVPIDAATHHASGHASKTTAAKHNTACVTKHMGRYKSAAAHMRAEKWCMAHHQY